MTSQKKILGPSVNILIETQRPLVYKIEQQILRRFNFSKIILFNNVGLFILPNINVGLFNNIYIYFFKK